MAHDAHFLERGVERMADPHLRLALRLYQDPELVKYILEQANLPPGDEHLALAFDEAGEGPYALVARSGRFVTCLGPGMNLKTAIPIARSRLDAWIARHELLTQANRYLQDTPLVRDCVGASLDGEFGQSRETMALLQTVAPVSYLVHANQFYQASVVVRTQARVLRPLANGVKPTPLELRGMRSYAAMYWSTAHDVPLFAVDVRSKWEPEFDKLIPRAGLACFESLEPLHALRATWMMAHVGEPILATLEAWLQNAAFVHEFTAAVLTLATMALRHPHLRPRILPLLLGEPPDTWDDHARRLQGHYLPAFRRVAEDPAAAVGRQLAWGRQVLDERCGALRLAPETLWQAAGDQADAVAAAGALHLPGALLDDEPLLGRLMDLTPWLASCELPDLFLPEAVAKLLRRPLKGEEGIALMRKRREVTVPVRAVVKPGRNERCMCQSGKKYKVCCGR